jgi:hypothetical protein
VTVPLGGGIFLSAALPSGGELLREFDEAWLAALWVSWFLWWYKQSDTVTKEDAMVWADRAVGRAKLEREGAQ